MSALAILFAVMSLVFAVLFLIDCIRLRRQINAYVKSGIVCGLIAVAIDTAILPAIPDFLSIMPIHRLIVLDVLALVRVTLFACMGMYCCSVLNTSAFPAIGLLRKTEERRRFFGKPFFVSVVTVIVLSVGYSVILFKLTTPSLSKFLRGLSETQSARLGLGSGPSLVAALVALEFAFVEEITFRLGIQNYLARIFRLQGCRYWIAIVLTTLFWSLAHANTLDPEWVKVAQVLPLGLALGFVFRRYGAETCILIHGVFNLIMMSLGSHLITR